MDSSRALKQFGLGAIVPLFLAACGGGGGGSPAPSNNLEPNSVMAAVIAKVGGTPMSLVQGAQPPPSTNSNAPKALVGVSNSTNTPGSTATIPLNVQSSAVIQKIYAKVRGAGSFFQGNLPGSQSLRFESKRVGAKRFENSSNFNFSLDIPASLGTGEFCVDLSVEDAGQLVSNLSGFCLNVVTQISEPADDQPSANDLPSTLAGGWRGACQVFDTDSGKIGFAFGLPNTYEEFFELWEGNTSCTGNPTTSGAFIAGTYLAGNTRFNPQAGTHERPFDFTPQQNTVGFTPCFNLLRVVGEQLFLGIPVGATFTDAADEPGSCVSANSRPLTVATALPFTKGSLPTNTSGTPPVANAGPDQTVAAGASVTLNGSSSTDSLGGADLTFSWTGGGGQVSLQNANSAIASFVAPSDSFTTILTFTLTVANNSNGATNSDTVQVTVNPGSQEPLTVNAGPDQTTTSARTVTLQGSRTPSSGTSVQWTQQSGPAVTLSDATTLAPSFTTPTVNQGTENLVFRMTVSRSGSPSVADEVSVLVSSVALNTGTLRFTLTWDQANDQDLYVQEPSGNLIFRGGNFKCATPASGNTPASACTPKSANGGSLDVENTSGFGPENIFYSSVIADGNYCFGVQYFSSSGVATNVTVNTTVNDVLEDTRSQLLGPPNPQSPTKPNGFAVMTVSGSSFTFREAISSDFPGAGGGASICPAI